MRHAALLIFLLFLAGCVTYQPARLVKARFKPDRSGIAQLGKGMYSEQDKRKEVSALMKKFCAPQRAEIVEINNQSTPTGSTSTQGLGIMSGTTFNETTFADESFVHFQCVDTESAELDF